MRSAVSVVVRTSAWALAIGAVWWSSSGQNPARAATPAFGHSAIAVRDGEPVFDVDGKPFFVYGAAFFYERLPRATWRTALYDLKYNLGINTLDLYVPWNWHELRDGDFDFTGRTNPRRDLRGLLRLAREFGFKLIVRPGPVIRNEWCNGGYPAWLLARPEYHMPLRDRLEGRYPPTATLQNAHSDDAATQWLRNPTHLQYTKHWLRAALAQFEPEADDVLAIALDDDQGAYLDNQTWPAPHLQAYLKWLRAAVQSDVGPRVPTFINTYQMKVTASSPVWAMGNWYQSAAYALGEHDRAQLEFSTGLLQTRPRQPLWASEFQAGWLEGPQDILPRPAAPSNTLLAMETMLGMGVRGIINFPAQDTLYPAGWEVPFANAFYAWDAALPYSDATSMLPRSHPDSALRPVQRGVPGVSSSRAVPTRTVGEVVATFGTMLAAAHVVPDAAIAYLTSAYDPSTLTNADVAALAAATMVAQRSCRRLSLTCELIDLRYADLVRLRRFPMLIVPDVALSGPRLRASRATSAFVPAVRHVLAFYRSLPFTTVLAGAEPSSDAVAAALHRAHAVRVVEGAPGASFAQGPNGAGFVTLLNYGLRAQTYARIVVHARSGTVILPATTLRPHSAALLPLDVPLRMFVPSAAPGDRFTSSCAVTRVAQRSQAASVKGLLFEIDPSATEQCGFELHRRGRTRATSVRAGFDLIGVDAAGRFTLEKSAQPHAAVAAAPLGTLPIRNDLFVEEPRAGPTVSSRDAKVSSNDARASSSDTYRDGEPTIVLDNDVIRVVASPDAGGRGFVFEDNARRTNAFTTVGALRDDVLLPPPLSTSDRIATYTNQMSAGTFNRPYRATILGSGRVARVRMSYDAPDAYPHGAYFERVLTLAPHSRCLAVALTSRFHGADPLSARQRAVTASSLTLGNPRAPSLRLLFSPAKRLTTFPARPLGARNVTGLFDPHAHELVLEAWTRGNPSATQEGRTNSLLTRIPEARSGTTRVVFDLEPIATYGQALARARTFEAAPSCAVHLPSVDRRPVGNP